MLRPLLRPRSLPKSIKLPPSCALSTKPDITLYTWGTPNGIKASITLEELSLPYKVFPIDISTNIQKEKWFLDINPNGRIPAITDGTQRVFESGAIMLYLTDRYDIRRTLSYERGTPESIELLSWLMFQMGGIGPMQGQANHFRVYANVRSDYGIKRYIDETRRLYSVLDSRLAKSAYLAGSKYTIADIANFAWVRSGPVALEIGLEEWPALAKWVAEIEARDAVKKGVVVPYREGNSPEQVAERFKGLRARMDALGNTDKH
ncbi:hypothetical protein ASPZODRAFT_54543 [Penicilliopsis zonata CBS 506.65]|uniref:Glutathione S-transferase n=1 Tax=Penicilliopsis zonata CBS 506.65 TaxID=1073090 RepID=A0A1L9SWP7_9EURO|nr:hypothetical protein ASPZODRAFT_54543 [Penicilliopsis zonata CBS 506.65]OJJ51537.1 hypothetical protein ASPZODRAFT_54543 [Penicilliopsis zonata CBS 506.65]